MTWPLFTPQMYTPQLTAMAMPAALRRSNVLRSMVRILSQLPAHREDDRDDHEAEHDTTRKDLERIRGLEERPEEWEETPARVCGDAVDETGCVGGQAPVLWCCHVWIRHHGSARASHDDPVLSVPGGASRRGQSRSTRPSATVRSRPLAIA